MNAKMVNFLTDPAPARLSLDDVATWRDRMNLLRNGFQPLMESRDRDAVLMFGMPGTGKSLFADHLGLMAWEQNRQDLGLRIDCRIAQTLSEDEAKRGVADIMEYFSNQPSGSDSGWIVVVKGMESLFAPDPGEILTAIGVQLFEILNQDNHPALVLGVTNNPSVIDPTVRSKFSKVVYFKPVAVRDLGNWLRRGGLAIDSARVVAPHLIKSAGISGSDYVAPLRLLRELESLSEDDRDIRQIPPEEIARSLALISDRFFVRKSIATEYEQKYYPLIQKSQDLEELFNIENS